MYQILHNDKDTKYKSIKLLNKQLPLRKCRKGVNAQHYQNVAMECIEIRRAQRWLSFAAKSNMSETVADIIIRFNEQLDPKLTLPPGIRILNPYREDPEAHRVSNQFYRKYYSDNLKRKLILGINPGRFGAGVTGVPFTDPKRLTERCKIPYTGKMLHEPSSVFVYDMISAFGGENMFFKRVYISSMFPLGLARVDAQGKLKNYNYYDSKAMLDAVYDYIKWNIQQQIRVSGTRDVCYCLGTGKNYALLSQINKEERFFETIIPLEHPRYIVQYRQKLKDTYIRKYVDAVK